MISSETLLSPVTNEPRQVKLSAISNLYLPISLAPHSNYSICILPYDITFLTFFVASSL